MKRIQNYLSTPIKKDDFQGTLYYVVINSYSKKDMCLFMLDNKHPMVITKHCNEFDTYNEILKMVLDNDITLDLFWLHGNQSFGWCIPNYATTVLLEEIVKELG